MHRSTVIDTYSSMTSHPCEDIETGMSALMSSLRTSDQKSSRGNQITPSLGSGMVLPYFCSIVIVALMARPERPTHHSIRIGGMPFGSMGHFSFVKHPKSTAPRRCLPTQPLRCCISETILRFPPSFFERRAAACVLQLERPGNFQTGQEKGGRDVVLTP